RINLKDHSVCFWRSPVLSISLPIITAAPVRQDEETWLDWFGSDTPDWHQFAVDERSFLLVADQSRIFEIDGAEFRRHISRLGPGTTAAHVRAEFGIPSRHAVDDTPIEAPPLRALSLAVAQKCNLGCTYCYAQEGDFGGQAKAMSLDVALAAVERLFK